MTVPTWIGLCAACSHARAIQSSKGSVFVVCEFAKVDSRFSKYPPLPVLRCPAFHPRESAPQPPESETEDTS